MRARSPFRARGRQRIAATLCVCSTLLHCGTAAAADVLAQVEEWRAANADRFGIYAQTTGIWQNKWPFPALYTNLNGSPNSLLPTREGSWTFTATAFVGLRLWSGAAVYLAPEVISEVPLSGLKGLGGAIQNAELQKTGGIPPTLYRSRLFLRQTWDLGGVPVALDSGPLQLAQVVSSRRVVLTAGNLSVLDVFDRNRFAGDLRQQFLNMSFLTQTAYDFAADARGYSWGVAIEWYHDEWTLRAGRFIGPRNPNQLPLNRQFFTYYGDQIEIERRYDLAGRPGAMRLLAFRNRWVTGRFEDAIDLWQQNPEAYNATTCDNFNYGSANAGAPDLCWVRRPNVKLGAGINVEQAVNDTLGVFLRGFYADGRTEVYSFTSADRSLALGGILQGTRWGREQDTVGLGYGASWISSAHAEYLGLGGIDGFVGDGAINARAEQVVELYYRCALARALWATLDAQRIANPGYNADRGPVNIVGVRVHAEF
jgi:hypothetical protein